MLFYVFAASMALTHKAAFFFKKLVEYNWNEMRSLKDPSAHILLSNGRQIWVCPIKSCKIMGIICGKEIQLQFPIVIYLPVFCKTICQTVFC